MKTLFEKTVEREARLLLESQARVVRLASIAADMPKGEEKEKIQKLARFKRERNAELARVIRNVTKK